MRKTEVLFAGLIFILTLFFNSPFANAEEEENALNVEIAPSVSFAGVKGDGHKFEEDKWTSRGASGGIDSMSFSKELNQQDSLEFEGRAIAGNNEYNADLNFSREGVGGITFEFQQFRKYYDGTGGFYANFTPTNLLPIELNRDIHMDIGNFGIEAVLAKENSPEYSLGYEREYRYGAKSLVSWGSVTDGTYTRYINPVFINVDESVDKVHLGVKRVTADMEMSAKQTWESAKSETSKINSQTLNLRSGLTSSKRTKFENMDSDRYTTQLMFSKDLNKNCFMSLGLLYNHFTGGSMEQITDESTSSYNENHPLNPANVNQETVTFMPNISFTPLKDLVVGTGVKAEFEAKNADATYNRDYRQPTVPAGYTPDGTIDEFVNITTNSAKKKVAGNLQLKYSRIKNTVLYADTELEKQYISLFEVQDAFGPNPSSSAAFSRKTNTITDVSNFTLGGKWYPVSKVNITVEDKYKEKVVDNRNEFLTGDVVGGYRGFIDRMELSSNALILKLKYKPFKWMAATSGYTWDQGVYGIRTRALDSTEIAKYIIHAYSADVTFTPADYFYCSLFFERRNDFTSTRANGSGGQAIAAQLPNYKANVDVLGFNYSYACSKDTSITGGYSMYYTDNYNDFSATGLPLGLNNLSQNASLGIKQALGKDRSVDFKYNYSNYAEDSNNHIDDYEAHIIYAAMNLAF